MHESADAARVIEEHDAVDCAPFERAVLTGDNAQLDSLAVRPVVPARLEGHTPVGQLAHLQCARIAALRQIRGERFVPGIGLAVDLQAVEAGNTFLVGHVLCSAVIDDPRVPAAE
ncbi:hypothetical protein D9M68_928670 [compost metagenome]